MKPKVQVKGTLPLIADFLNTTEKRIYEIFNLDSSTKPEIKNEKKGGENDETTNKSKTIRTSSQGV